MSLAPFTPGASSKVPPLSPLPTNIEILTPDSCLPGCSDEPASYLPAWGLIAARPSGVRTPIRTL
jgi:hypothetical protein